MKTRSFASTYQHVPRRDPRCPSEGTDHWLEVVVLKALQSGWLAIIPADGWGSDRPHLGTFTGAPPSQSGPLYPRVRVSGAGGEGRAVMERMTYIRSFFIFFALRPIWMQSPIMWEINNRQLHFSPSTFSYLFFICMFQVYTFDHRPFPVKEY